MEKIMEKQKTPTKEQIEAYNWCITAPESKRDNIKYIINFYDCFSDLKTVIEYVKSC